MILRDANFYFGFDSCVLGVLQYVGICIGFEKWFLVMCLFFMCQCAYRLRLSSKNFKIDSILYSEDLSIFTNNCLIYIQRLKIILKMFFTHLWRYFKLLSWEKFKDLFKDLIRITLVEKICFFFFRNFVRWKITMFFKLTSFFSPPFLLTCFTTVTHRSFKN